MGGWTVALLTGIIVIYGMVPYLDEDTIPTISPAIRIAYASLFRLVWAIFVCWIIFACTHNYGGKYLCFQIFQVQLLQSVTFKCFFFHKGFINQMLSWKAWLPLARITYTIYLIHSTFLIVYHARSRKPYFYSSYDLAIHYFGILLMATLWSILIHLVLEAPFLSLVQLVLKPTKQPSKLTQALGRVPYYWIETACSLLYFGRDIATSLLSLFSNLGKNHQPQERKQVCEETMVPVDKRRLDE